MNHETLLAEIARLRSTILLMDSTYRAQRNRYTPVEIQNTLKALRELSLSVEASGLDDCFISEEVLHANN